MSVFDAEAMAEALYLHLFPHMHGGHPPPRVWSELPEWQRVHWRHHAEQLAGMYESTLIPVEQRTLKLRNVNPELHARIHGGR